MKNTIDLSKMEKIMGGFTATEKRWAANAEWQKLFDSFNFGRKIKHDLSSILDLIATLESTPGYKW